MLVILVSLDGKWEDREVPEGRYEIRLPTVEPLGHHYEEDISMTPRMQYRQFKLAGFVGSIERPVPIFMKEKV